MGSEKCVFAQNFHVPVPEVEDPMSSHGCGIYGEFVVRSIWDREVGQGRDTDGRRLSDRSDRGYGDRIRDWSDERS